jgi:hypothetical protein
MDGEILHRTLKIEGYKTMVDEILHRTLKIEGYKTMVDEILHRTLKIERDIKQWTAKYYTEH